MPSKLVLIQGGESTAKAVESRFYYACWRWKWGSLGIIKVKLHDRRHNMNQLLSRYILIYP